jgi:hypothetical protein
MAVCAYVKPDGTRCNAQPLRSESWCHAHHSDLGEERTKSGRRGGRLGGRGRRSGELSGIKAQLQQLTDSVLAGALDRADASVCG